MIKNILVYLLCLICFLSKAQNKHIVFESGQEGYANYRIPAMITLKNGDILAFCEGRKNNSADYGDIDIVMKRSIDKGKTWSAIQLIVDYDHYQAGNAAPVVDYTDRQYPKGRIFLFYNTGKTTEGEVRKGKGLREVWYITSIDNGKSWSSAQNITTSVHKPNKPEINPAYHFSEDWRSYANTPGHAMQFGWGKYKGRIYVAANHSAGKPQAHFKDYKAHGYYTDDHGASFHLSDDITFEGSNEAMAAQLSNDTLMVNARNQQGNTKNRIIALSNDGGSTWVKTFYDNQLPDPICQGSVLSFTDKKGNVAVAVCNNADTVQRNKLTLRLSKDNGRSWYFNKVIADGKNVGKDKDYSGYSDIILLPKNQIGVLYEADDYSKILFETIKIK